MGEKRERIEVTRWRCGTCGTEYTKDVRGCGERIEGVRCPGRVSPIVVMFERVSPALTDRSASPFDRPEVTSGYPRPEWVRVRMFPVVEARPDE